MKKEMNKKSQFYLMAAIIIAVALSGLAAVTTYSSSSVRQRTLENLGSELRQESAKIVDYGIYNGENITKLLDEFTGKYYAPYFLKKTDSTAIVFIYGNENELYSSQYKKEETGTISASIGGSTNWMQLDTFLNKTKIDVSSLPDNNVQVNILGQDYQFKLRGNEMFYFIIIKEEGGERHVERN